MTKENVLFRILENHPNDSRVKFREDNVFQTLSSRMGTGGGNVPLIMEDYADARTQNQILCLLQETYGAEKIIEWGIAVMATLQQTEVLQPRVHESCIQGKTQEGNKLDDSTLPCPKLVAGWLLRGMRKQSECGCTPQRRKSTEQLNREFTEVVSELPHKDPSSTKALFDMWSKGKGLGILQQTLYQIQEIWKSSDGVRKGGDLMDSVSAVVRRLTPL